jgi:hypothetical protein
MTRKRSLIIALVVTLAGVTEGTRGQVANEVEALNVELQAPPRVRTIEDAVPATVREPWGIAALVSRQ